MIFIILYLFLATALGWVFVEIIMKSFWERVILGGILGITFLTAINFLLALLLPLPLATFGTILASLVIILSSIKNKKFQFAIEDINKRSFIFFIMLGWGIFFVYLLWQTHLFKSDGFFFASPSTYGDFPFHLTLITNFAYGENFPPANPLAPFMHLSYHFFVDFLSSIFLSTTNNLYLSLIIPSAVLGMLVAGSLSLLTYKVGKSVLASILTPFIFFFNGGIGFLKFFEVIANQGFLPAIFSVHNRYAHIPEWGVEYPNILAEILMAERALFLGLPLAISALFFLILWNETRQQKYLIFAGIATGFLPYTNIYGFIVIGLVTSLLFLINLLQQTHKKPIISSYILFGFITSLLATPFAFWILPQIASKESFIRIALMQWPPLANSTQKMFYWVTNFGVVPFLALLALFKIPAIKSSAKVVLGLLLLITPLAHIILFQPFPWDNNRFVLFPFIAMAVLASVLLAQLIESPGVLNRLIAVSILIISIFQGVLVTIHDPLIRYPLYSQKDFEFANYIRTNTKSKDIILTARNHNHPVPTLAGRRIVLGFGGYLETQGINDPIERTTAIKKVFQGEDKDSSLIRLYGINYIVVGPWEKTEFSYLREDLLAKKYKHIYDDGIIKVFKTRSD